MMTLQQQTRIAIFIEADDTGRLMEFITVLTALLSLLLMAVEFTADVVSVPVEIVTDTLKWLALMPFGNRFVFGVG